jgi:hypothetical protein
MWQQGHSSVGGAAEAASTHRAMCSTLPCSQSLYLRTGHRGLQVARRSGLVGAESHPSAFKAEASACTTSNMNSNQWNSR